MSNTHGYANPPFSLWPEGGEPKAPVSHRDLSSFALAAPNLSQPLASIDWGYTVPDNNPGTATTNINVFFAASGVTVTDGYSDNPTFTTTGWNATEIAAAMTAFQNFEDICDVTFTVVNSIAEADFVMFESGNAMTTVGYWGVGGGQVTYGGTNYTLDGWGVFNSAEVSWTAAGLAVGGYGYITLIHEIGHGMGLAHPHDNGGTSSVMQGVTAAFGDYGDFGLNQGIWTTMSYNDGWHSLNGNMVMNQGYGWQGTLMTLDIAVLQDIYGSVAHNTGANTYTLPTANAAGTFYQAIWDTGGVDTIVNPGSGTAIINLNAAPLTNNASGGGYVSYVNGIMGGFTVANGVVIENATGGSGIDTIIGNPADNFLIGGAGADTIDGGDGNDTLSYAASDAGVTLELWRNTVATGSGGHGSGDMVENIENIVGSSFGDYFSLGPWLISTVRAGDGNDTVFGGAAAEITAYGEGGDDTLIASSGQSYLYGGAGNDIFSSSGGSALFVGGDGADSVDYLVSNAVTVNLTSGLVSGGSQSQLVSIENAGGSFYNDSLIGNGGANRLYGYDGADYLNGAGGADTLLGSIGDDILIGGAGADRLDGAEDNDTASYVDSAAGVNVNLSIAAGVSGHAWGGNAAGDWLLGIENLTGSRFVDSLVGNAGRNVIDGFNGNDRLHGGGGNDDLHGGNGDDLLLGGAGADLMDGGSNTDTADYSASSAAVNAGVNAGAVNAGGDAEGDTLWVENITGTAFADTLIGNSVINVLRGAGDGDYMNAGGNADFLYGEAGDDRLIGGDGADLIDGGLGVDTALYVNAGGRIWADLGLNAVTYSGNGAGDTLVSIENITGSLLDDFIFGNGAANRLDGYLGNDQISGGGGGDTIIGGIGDDRIDGGVGNDTLSGGADLDVFVFSALGWGQDTITDWQDGNDRVDFSALGLGFADFSLSQVGADAVMTLIANPNLSVTFQATAMNLIDASDFA